MKTKALYLPYINISTKALFFMLATVLVFVFASYVYLVNKTIMNVVARESAVQEAAELSGTVGELEFEYMAHKNSVTLDIAYAQGFKDTSPTRFLARGQQSTTLTYNTSR